jgi:hypothetical protein
VSVVMPASVGGEVDGDPPSWKTWGTRFPHLRRCEALVVTHKGQSGAESRMSTRGHHDTDFNGWSWLSSSTSRSVARCAGSVSNSRTPSGGIGALAQHYTLVDYRVLFVWTVYTEVVRRLDRRAVVRVDEVVEPSVLRG